MTIHLKDFQRIGNKSIKSYFLDLWKTGNYKIPLIFKAPTGAGFHFKKMKNQIYYKVKDKINKKSTIWYSYLFTCFLSNRNYYLLVYIIIQIFMAHPIGVWNLDTFNNLFRGVSLQRLTYREKTTGIPTRTKKTSKKLSENQQRL